jgi:subtilisin family serine protease
VRPHSIAREEHMPKVNFGRKGEPGFELDQSRDLLVVRTRSGGSIARAAGVPDPAAAELADASLVVSYPEAGVEVFRVPVGKSERSLDARKTGLRQSTDVRFAGGVLVDPATKEPVLYTENIFVKFKDDKDPDDCLAVLQEAGLKVKERVTYAANAFFTEAPEGTGQRVFDIANVLLKRADVEYSHPELIRPRARKQIFQPQWHLKKTTVGGVSVDAHANVEGAHAVTRGAGITIAIIDDGVDIDHPEFGGPGKVVAPRDATDQTSDPRPRDSFGTGLRGDNHGTACAGVACANGTAGASGVAPAARLMPIRLQSALGSIREAQAFDWAVTNGADVISCSWGPTDGDWFNLSDPVHNQTAPMPASTRLAIENAVNNGRGGKGCVVLFAAGNGNESVDNDGYASHAGVIAVAACNDRGKRSVYSDFGNAVWCAFPSNDFGHAPFSQPTPLTRGIWTVDRRGTAGYNNVQNGQGDTSGDFADNFGGTSSACPGAAGVAALVLSVNPNLKAHEVRDVLKRSCDKIDPAGGAYNAAGHSAKYGFGRLNALTAVQLAQPQPRSELVVGRQFDAVLPDLATKTFTLAVADTTPLAAVETSVDITHTFIGDLVIRLFPPSGTGVAPITLHNRAGGSTDDLRKTYDASKVTGLTKLVGKNPAGTWTLEIKDAAAQDSGKLVSWSVKLVFPHPDRVVRDATSPKVPVSRRRAVRIRRAPARGGRIK